MAKRPWNAGKPKKKPDFDPEKLTQELLAAAAKAHQTEDEKHPTLKEISAFLEQQGYGYLNPIKVRKLLITAGVYESEKADRVRELRTLGKSEREISELLHMSHASVSSYMPYAKAVYKLDETPNGDISVDAERQRLYKMRKCVAAKLAEDPTEEHLWAAVTAFAGYPLETDKGLKFTYSVKETRNGVQGRELVFSRKEKPISQSTVLMAYRRAQELDGRVPGPKALGTFGASYLYPLFKRLGIITYG